MAQYIDKSAVVAEIERKKIGYNVDGKHSVEYDTTRKILSIIDTLEVKEVDLELTWKDLALIRLAFDATEDNINHGCLKISPMTKEYYQEVLKRFKDYKDGGKG